MSDPQDGTRESSPLPGKGFNGWEKVGDEPLAGLAASLPAPAEGRFVIAREPPTLDGYAEMRGELRHLPQHDRLALEWVNHRGEEVLYPTDGYLLTHGREDATWLPQGWEMDVFPAGWTWEHLRRWFDLAIHIAEKEVRPDIPAGSDGSPPHAPSARGLVMHAHLIVRHLAPPDPPEEPRVGMDRFGCLAELRAVRRYLEQALATPRPATGAAHLPTEAARPAGEGSEYARFLDLDAKVKSTITFAVPLEEMLEYQRLLVKYGSYTVDLLYLGPCDGTRVPDAGPILNTDCLPIPGDTPRVCPRARPRLPEELLPGVARRWRELGLVRAGETVLWCGRQAEMDSLCTWRYACSCFDLTDQIGMLAKGAAGLFDAAGQVVGPSTGAGEGAEAVRSVRKWLRLLEPLLLIRKHLPVGLPPELYQAHRHLLVAVSALRECFPNDDLSAVRLDQLPGRLVELRRALEVFDLAAAGPGALPAAANPAGDTPCSLAFEPGAFVYRGERVILKGKPLEVLRALAEAPGRVLTIGDLLERVWPGATVGDEAVRSAVSDARKALREAMKAARVKAPADPIPTADRGTGRLAWRFDLP